MRTAQNHCITRTRTHSKYNKKVKFYFKQQTVQLVLPLANVQRPFCPVLTSEIVPNTRHWRCTDHAILKLYWLDWHTTYCIQTTESCKPKRQPSRNPKLYSHCAAHLVLPHSSIDSIIGLPGQKVGEGTSACTAFAGMATISDFYFVRNSLVALLEALWAWGWIFSVSRCFTDFRIEFDIKNLLLSLYKSMWLIDCEIP